MAKAKRKRPRARARKRHGPRRAWLLLPIIILALMLGWLYRHELVQLVPFQFDRIDFSRRPGETTPNSQDRGRITPRDRKELEKILKNQ